MYGKTGSAAVAAGAVPASGIEATWMLLAVVMVAAVAAAIWRLIPRAEE